MALIKCQECGQDVSDKAFSCPHCGNPMHIYSALTEKVSTPVGLSVSLKENKKVFSFKRVVRVVIIGAGVLILLAIIFLLSSKIPSANSFNQKILNASQNAIQAVENIPSLFTGKTDSQIQNNESGNSQQTISSTRQSTTNTTVNSLTVQINPDGSKTYPVQHISLWGYEFYTSKVDQTGNIDIGSEQKQTIAKLLKNLGFPPNLTSNLVIVNTDPAIIGPNDKIQLPWSGSDVVTIALQPEGGLYDHVLNGAVIFLNNLSGNNSAVLTHELGHHIGYYLTDAEWVQFYKLRGIPDNMPKYSSNWNLAPQEDFAEAYKATYKSSVVGSGGYSFGGNEWAVKTQYGSLVPRLGLDTVPTCEKLYSQAVQNYIQANTAENSYGFSVPINVINKAESVANDNPQVQKCRRDNIGSLEPLFGGLLYGSQVNPATEQFVKDVVARMF